MLNAGASSPLAWHWLLPAMPFVALAARLLRGLWVLRAFEQQRGAAQRRRPRRASPACLCVADALHKPLAALSATAIALRLAFFSLAVGGERLDASTLFFWLAQAPGVALAALSAYLALLLLAVVCAGHWPGAGSANGAGKRRLRLVVAAATGACLAFCALLVAAVTLLAVARTVSLVSEQQRRHKRLVQVQDELRAGSDGDAAAHELRGLARAALLYLAFVWSVLGLLLLRTQANATRVLLGYATTDSLPHCVAPDPDKTLPPVFVVKLSRWAVLLALLQLLRGGYSAGIALLAAPEQLARWFFLAPGGHWSALRPLLVLDLCWELLVLLTVVSLLKTMPLAVYSWPSRGLRARAATTESTAETDASDPTDESDETEESDETAALLLLPSSSPSSESAAPVVGFRFQLPTLHDLVQDYVIVTRQSLTRRSDGPGDVIYTYAHGEPERCVHQQPSASPPQASATRAETALEVAGSEFMECQCPPRRRRDPGGILPEAQVPLLSDEELADESFEVIDALSDSHSDESQVLSASS